MDISELVDNLWCKNPNTGCGALKELETISERTSEVYPFFDQFAAMLDHDNSYVRTRGLLLIAAQAKWDTNNKINGIIDQYLEHIMDKRPITSRQCVQSLPKIAKSKPELKDIIVHALKHADPGIYPDSMESLVRKDIQTVLNELA